MKFLAILAVFALIPVIAMGIISILEMNQASRDVQSNISSLSTSLNRSALSVAPNDADQVQLAIAKARQYDEFFKRIASENELIAGYAALADQNESCQMPPGIWVAPSGDNQSALAKREATIRSLCAPARIMQRLLMVEPSLLLSYIGTEDGVLVTWPYSNETFSNTAPFGYKERQYYSEARIAKKTIWTEVYTDGKGQMATTVATPIYQGGKFAGIAGMDVALRSIREDLASIKGRGYPFIIDGSGRIIFAPAEKPQGALKELFASGNLSEVGGDDARKLVQGMIQGRSGLMVVGLKDADGYVAFSPISKVGWSFGIAYPVEEMSLPARFIDAGIKDVAKSATQGLNDAIDRTRSYALLILALTGALMVMFAVVLGRRMNIQMNSMLDAASRISRGDFNVEIAPSGEMGALGEAFNEMARGLKAYSSRLEGEAVLRGGSGKESDFLEGVKRNLVPSSMPEVSGYEILALYQPAGMNRFDLYDVVEAENKIALAMAGVGGDGIQAAMLAIMSRTLIRALPDKLDPTRAISELNMQINQLAHGMNLACFYALLDPTNHTLEYVNAGFNPPFIVDEGGMVDTLGGGGIALGMLDRMDLQTERIPIQSGDVMVMYSNGIVEAENAFKEQFGIERLISLVIGNRNRPASEILAALKSDLMDFSKKSLPQKDITLVIVKRIES